MGEEWRETGEAAADSVAQAAGQERDSGEEERPSGDWHRLADFVPDEGRLRRRAREYAVRTGVPDVSLLRIVKERGGGSPAIWVNSELRRDIEIELGLTAAAAPPGRPSAAPVPHPDPAALVDRLAESGRRRGEAEGRVGELVAARDAATADRDRERARADRLGQELAELRRERDALRLQLSGLREAALRWHAGLRRWRTDPPLPAELASDAARLAG